jgi:hypothetical protein
VLRLANCQSGSQSEFPANEIVDAGFLELVRYGIRRPDDPIIVDSLRVVDAVLKTETRLRMYYIDIAVPWEQTAPIRFTFLWAATGVEQTRLATFCIGDYLAATYGIGTLARRTTC